MPLRLVNKQRTHSINACDTTFQVVSMTIGEKEKLIYDIQNVGSEDGAYERLLDVIVPVIVKIDQHNNQSVRKVFEQLEDLAQVREIIQAVICHCVMSEDESKNSPSSSEQLTPESAGNAGNPVDPVGAPVSTTPTQMDS